MELLEERNKDIVELRKNRWKLREIGLKYNISRERVRQILRSEKQKKASVDK